MKLGAIGVIVAARTGSSRLPGKALLPLQGVPMITYLLRRLSSVKTGRVVFATTTLSADDRLADIVHAEGVPVYRGEDADVVARYVGACQAFGFDTAARVTGDCPFVDAFLVDWCNSEAARLEAFDLATTKGRFPVGLDIEIFSAARMQRLHDDGNLSPAEREHLTLYFYDRKDEERVRIIPLPEGWHRTAQHFTVDTQPDYEAAQRFAAALAPTDPIQRLLEIADSR